jgi:hypothetical protein
MVQEKRREIERLAVVVARPEKEKHGRKNQHKRRKKEIERALHEVTQLNPCCLFGFF